MHTLNHALWGMTLGRVVKQPIAGAVIGATPDILTVPLFGYYQFKHKLPPEKSPKWLLNEYSFVHNWFVGLAVVGVSFSFSHTAGVLSLAYLWHLIEDAFVHTKMAMPFLWPVWKGKIQKFSVQEHKWVQVIEIIIIVIVNIIMSVYGVGW